MKNAKALLFRIQKLGFSIIRNFSVCRSHGLEANFQPEMCYKRRQHKALTQPPLRRRVRRGLLKVDELHALSRDIVYGKRGHMTERDFHEMMKTCSCLTLILACIIYWQAKEIGRVVSECSPEEEGIDISLLEHVSPIEWSNVLLYGEYVIDPGLIQ